MAREKSLEAAAAQASMADFGSPLDVSSKSTDASSKMTLVRPPSSDNVLVLTKDYPSDNSEKTDEREPTCPQSVFVAKGAAPALPKQCSYPSLCGAVA